MSPVLSPSAPVPRVRRRFVRQSAASLFPECSETNPSNRTGELTPLLTGPSGSHSNEGTASCPSLDPAVNGESRSNGAVRSASAPLVGIARLAANSPPAETHRKSAERPEYFVLPTKSILNRCDSNRVPFEWTINPYRGCEFACKYCYARYTHEYMELDGKDFEKKIFVKKDAGPLLAYDMRKYSYQSESSEGRKPEHIAIGTATDPYQPAEREYGVTRACLEELAKREGLSVSITTKSNQVVRDIDLLKKIDERSTLSINMTVTTLRPRLARMFEPRAPRPDLRLAALKQLREAGLAAGVSAAPMLPGITDREGELEALAAAASEAGAQWFWSGALFLMPSSAKQFMPFLREKFPRLTQKYEEWYTRNAYAPKEYRKWIGERVARLRRLHGFQGRPREERPRPTLCEQMTLSL